MVKNIYPWAIAFQTLLLTIRYNKAILDNSFQKVCIIFNAQEIWAADITFRFRWIFAWQRIGGLKPGFKFLDRLHILWNHFCRPLSYSRISFKNVWITFNLNYCRVVLQTVHRNLKKKFIFLPSHISYYVNEKHDEKEKHILFNSALCIS